MNRDCLQLVRIKVRIVRYLRANQVAVLGRNEAVKILLRKANGEHVKYNVAME
jgi:hypothetical protein